MDSEVTQTHSCDCKIFVVAYLSWEMEEVNLMVINLWWWWLWWWWWWWSWVVSDICFTNSWLISLMTCSTCQSYMGVAKYECRPVIGSPWQSQFSADACRVENRDSISVGTASWRPEEQKDQGSPHTEHQYVSGWDGLLYKNTGLSPFSNSDYLGFIDGCMKSARSQYRAVNSCGLKFGSFD